MRLRFRSPVDARDPLAYAKWVRGLRERNGVYVIRDAETCEVVYVGESHTNRLYSTLTRHFQYWDGKTAGTTYEREDVHVAVGLLDAAARDVVKGQVDLIEELAPRDNTHHQLGFHTDDEDIDSDDFADDLDGGFADAW